MLEESLLEFPGALVLVTPDRYLLDRVSTQLLALDGRGGATFFADYAQWELGQVAPAPPPKPAGKVSASSTKRKRLGYRDRREWEQMEARILEAERQLEDCRRAAADPAVASDHRALHERLEALAAAQATVEQLYARWAELEAKVKE